MTDLTTRQRSCLRGNLVRMSDIITRTGSPSSTVSTWKTAYEDWPEPLVPADRRSTGAIWWWPDIEAFLRNHALPDTRLRRPGTTRRPFHRWQPGDSGINDLGGQDPYPSCGADENDIDEEASYG